MDTDAQAPVRAHPWRATISALADEHLRPDTTLQRWWEALAAAGLSVPTWPRDRHGLGVDRATAGLIATELRSLGAPTGPSGIGTMLAGPTILRHGTDEQKARLLPSIVTGRSAWCQLFSEPEAGSDLASLRTVALADGSSYRVTGQKVWTSNGHVADRGMLLARTDPASSGRDGISWMVLDMDQPGVEVRPLREMTGRSLFTEVFLDGAIVRSDDVIGALGDGWAAARTTLGHERSGLTSGGGVGLTPGTKAGLLGVTLGELAALRPDRGRWGSGTAAAMKARCFDALRSIATSAGAPGPSVRRALVELHTLERLLHLGPTPRPTAAHGTAPSIGKLLHSRTVSVASEAASALLAEGRCSDDDRVFLEELVTFAPAVSIYGGTDQIQRNVVAERGLGLPRSS